MKICSKCNISKSLDCFYKRKTNKDGLWGFCKECDHLHKQEYYLKNKEKHLCRTKKYFLENKEKWKKYDKNFRKNNPSTPEQKLHRTIFDGIRRGCKNLNHNKDQSSLETVGLESWDKFKEHIESQFTEDMTWNNYGNKSQNWSIDHIIPISSAQTEEDIYKLNNYTNLRPMWHSDNVRKRNKI